MSPLRVKRDKVMELSDWSVQLLIGCVAQIPPEPFVASIFFQSFRLKRRKIFICGRKTVLLLRSER